MTAGASANSDGQLIRRAAVWIGDVLLPPRCLACGEAVDRHLTFCPSCWRDFDFICEPCCPVTGEPFAFDPGPGALSARAAARRPVYGRARAALVYNDAAARIVSRLKYGDRLELAPVLARFMAAAAGDMLKEADLLRPVPLHGRRLLWRRFNQSAELTRGLARLSGLPADPEVLRRHRPTRAQVGLSARARQRNVAGAFSLTPGKGGVVAGRQVLLVDDVMTTGATVEACARVLLRAGAAGVTVLTAARVAAAEAPPI